MIFEQFQAYCKARKITLMPYQMRLAEAFFSREDDVKTISGYGSGKTFLMSTIENFLEAAGAPRTKVHSSND